MVEKVDGRPFAKAVRERVLAPLGMTASDFEPTPAVKKNLAEGVMWTYHGREFPAPTFELGVAPAGCMYSTATDLARFMSVLFAGGKTPMAESSSRRHLQEMLTPQFAKAGAKKGFGLGFFVGDLDGHKRVGHGGAIYGFADRAGVPAGREAGRRGDREQGRGELGDVPPRRRRPAASPGGEGRQSRCRSSSNPSRSHADEARKLAGRYGDGGVHELIEAGGKLYHFAPGQRLRRGGVEAG